MFSHFPSKLHKATQVTLLLLPLQATRRQQNSTKRRNATKESATAKRAVSLPYALTLWRDAASLLRQRRGQRTWLFFFYVLRSVNEQHSGKCKAKRWSKKNVPSSAVSVKRERERQRVRTEVNEAHGERAQARESVRARERKQARRRPFDAVCI